MHKCARARAAPGLFLLSALVNPSFSQLVRVPATTGWPKLVYIPTRSVRSGETLLEGLQRPVYLDDARRPEERKSAMRRRRCYVISKEIKASRPVVVLEVSHVE